jgi:DHA3 family macrolide efflux protein-like MFS transporter
MSENVTSHDHEVGVPESDAVARPPVGSGPDARTLASFLVLWGGQALSLLGSQAVQFALIWWLTMETGSASILATAALIGLLPQVALGPVIGALVDRWNRKRVMLVADTVVALASLALALLFFAGITRIHHVFLILFVRALGGAFHVPAMLASTTLMVPKRHLTRIQGLNQSLQGGLTIVSAPLGALLLVWLAMGNILLVDVATALFALVPLVFIRVPQPVPTAASTSNDAKASLWREIVAGFSYLRARSGHMWLVCLSIVINLSLVPAFSLLPLLVLKEFNGTALQLGWMSSGIGIGAVAGGVVLGIWGGFRRRILTSLTALLGMGVAVLVLGLSPASGFLVPLIAAVVIGYMASLVNGPIHAVFQATIPPDLQGRVFTLLGSLCGIMAPLGLLLAGPVADYAGVRVWYVLGAAACLAMGTVAFFVPAIVHIEDREASTAPPRAETEMA